MTAAEYLSAHAARDDFAGFDRDNTLSSTSRTAWPREIIPDAARKGKGYSRGVPALPKRYRRMMHGDKLSIGGHDWEVITVFGHAPEHAALWCASKNVLISGDQVLPRITSNVAGVWGNQPDGNPLELFLISLGRFSHLPADALVLPSHERVFFGLHKRIAELHGSPRTAPRAAARGMYQPDHGVRGAAATSSRESSTSTRSPSPWARRSRTCITLASQGKVARRIDGEGIRRFVRA